MTPTPKEKADELRQRFGMLADLVVEEILKAEPTEPRIGKRSYDVMADYIEHSIEYWSEVLTELQKSEK